MGPWIEAVKMIMEHFSAVYTKRCLSIEYQSLWKCSRELQRPTFILHDEFEAKCVAHTAMTDDLQQTDLTYRGTGVYW